MSLLNDAIDRMRASDLRGPGYWRSLDELARTPQFEELLQREFPDGASEWHSPFSRRTFLSLMAASAALAGGLAGCRRPERRAMPYTRLPEQLTEGVPQFYATACERGGRALGLLAKCFEGRPVKLEGNPDHPASLGATDAMTQALVLELYDPDRSQGLLHRGAPADAARFEAALADLAARHRGDQGAGLRILSEMTTSPTTLAWFDRLLAAYPRARRHVWEPINDDASREAMRRLYGRPFHVDYDWGRADVILTLDADPLGEGLDAVRRARDFARRRRPEPHGVAAMNRLYAIEGVYSLTGAAADHRLRLRPSFVPRALLALAADLARTHGAQLPPVPAVPLDGIDARWIAAVADDLRAREGTGIVVVGPRQPVEAHMLAHAINLVFGRACVRLVEPADAAWTGCAESLADLARAMREGQVQTLVILGGNPVYDAPADLAFTEALAAVPDSIHLSLYANETSARCTWHVPRAHVLESWSDVRAADGTVSIVQPLIAPLYGGWTDAQLLARLAGNPTADAYELVMDIHRTTGGLTEAQWLRALHDGIVEGSVRPNLATDRTPDRAAAVRAAEALAANTPAADGTELVFVPDPKVYDGRFANNGWLQETPDPMTKLTWGNAALLSPATARRLGLGDVTAIERTRYDLVRLVTDAGSVELPAWVVPGMADDVVAIALGYGRERAGRVGDGVGVNVYPLRTSRALWVVPDVRVERAGTTVAAPATTQHHWMLDPARPIYLEAAAAQYEAKPTFAREIAGEAAGAQLWEPPHDYTEGPQWGMSVDLSACIGCNACMVACQAENNVPIVGRDQVARGREMHWIRIDRYFRGPLEDPAVAFQPVMCQHCENAPCEQVCPVAATTHSPDGLNQMVYNRCIGTRYCANNCPFKVRRFNFFDFHGPLSAVEKMRMNPDVTVRMRGVMEKCSFCVQRIHRVHQDAKARGAAVPTDAVQSACQQVCPTEAIVFGDVRDPQSRVSRLKALARDYALLGPINVRPRTSYLAKIRNPNPVLQG